MTMKPMQHANIDVEKPYSVASKYLLVRASLNTLLRYNDWAPNHISSVNTTLI